ncbi:hypothetical protein PVAND_003073 [Polypedilum vanderplanki]|uniref:NADP-dependent oxidoreductase domain-containing protein n=1 Tax=Polypedilum vanderplanki TaxID=319348 RepID=A0A9J6BTF9_POLVA|nr:hypothetical protein PVAND_003073 [Polypedilum vanderplanki]
MSLACQNTDDNNNNNNNSNNNQGQMSEHQQQQAESGGGADYTIYKLCAPIASLDCMEEFSGNTLDLNMGRSISIGSKTSLKNMSSTPGLRYKNLGKSGLRVSNVALGTWSTFSSGVSEEQAEMIIRLAYDSGINLFDLSDLHSGARAEIEFGNIIKKTNWKRMTYIVTVKIYWSIKGEERGLSKKHIIESVQASLKRLQLDYIDIVIIHKADSMCPMEEVVRAMNYVINKGWVLYWGTSKWSTTEIMEAYTNCREFNCITPIMEQSEYHMFCRDRAELYLPEMYNKIGVGLMAYGPLGMYLTDNTDRLFFSKGSLRSKTQNSSWTEDEVAKEDRVEEARRHLEKIRDLNLLAEKLGCSLTQLSVAWSLKHEPVQCLLIGAKTTEQLTQNLQALQLLPRLSVSVMLEIERIIDNKPVRPPMISTLQMRGLVSHANVLVADALGEVEANAAESMRGDEEEDIIEEQKEDGNKTKRIDDTKKLNLTITKIDEEQENDKIQIIQLTSPIKVRSPLGYRSSFNLSTDTPIQPICSTSNDLNVSTFKPTPVYLPSANIKSPSRPSIVPIPEAAPPRKLSIMSLRSLSLSMRIFKNRGRMSEGYIEPTILRPIGENRPSIFKMDSFEKNLKKFITRSNENAFQTYLEYQEQQGTSAGKQQKRSNFFKQQKVHARRSSMSDVPDPNINQRPLQLQSGPSGSHSTSNVKIETHKKEKKTDKTAEMLKEVRKRNIESAKRNNAPRRISTAY